MPVDAIISIHPKFAEAILEGSKSVELRRRIPALEIGTRLWIYSTRPTAAIVGSVIVSNIYRAKPDEVWKKYADESGVSNEEFEQYFTGTSQAVAICLKNPARVDPIHIDVLRNVWDGFHPPQVLRYIKPSFLMQLSTLIAA